MILFWYKGMFNDFVGLIYMILAFLNISMLLLNGNFLDLISENKVLTARNTPNVLREVGTFRQYL